MSIMEAWLAEQQRTSYREAMLESLPNCDCCGERIDAPKYLSICGMIICPDCIERNMEFNMEAIVE